MYNCPRCSASFSRSYNRDRHLNATHGLSQVVPTCSLCGASFTQLKQLKQHRLTHIPSTGFALLRSAFNRNCIIYRKIYQKKITSYIEAYASDQNDIKILLDHETNKKRNLKVALIANCEFLKYDGDGTLIDTYEIRIRTSSWLIRGTRDIREFQNHAYTYINGRIQDFEENGSNWILDEILYSDLEIGQCRALNGKCGVLDVTYPSHLKKIPTTSSSSNLCFARAVAFHFVKDRSEKKIRRFIRRKMCISGLKFPLDLEDVPKFERMNQKLKLKINILTTDDCEKFYPIYCGKQVGKKNVVNLLLYKSVDDEGICSKNYHYAYINDLAKLVRKKWKFSYQKIVFCGNCLCSFYCATLLNHHEKDCYSHKTAKIQMPDGDRASIQFEHFKRKFKTHLVGFYDFECMLVPSKQPCSKCAKAENNNCQHKTIEKNKHVPITYSYLILDVNGTVIREHTYTGLDCMDRFIAELLDIEPSLRSILDRNVNMIYSDWDKMNFLNANACHICEETFNLFGLVSEKIHDLTTEDIPLEQLVMKVRDHNHITGEYLGAAHLQCNFQRRECKTIPMFCHNGNGYDNHILLKHLKNDRRIGTISGLPINSEKFRTLNFNCYTFLDSLAFLNASLDELVGDLERNHPFNIMDQLDFYEKGDLDKKELLLKKGVFPYEYFQEKGQLKLHCLPQKEKFYSELTNKHITGVEYNHAMQVWSKFECDTFQDYVELYCKTDVCLLAEVVSRFRDQIHEECGLDPYHYISLPQLGYDIMLKKTKVKIGLITDINQLLMVEQGIRGGFSFISNRYCESVPSSNSKKAYEKVDKNDVVRLIYLDGTYFI